MCNFILSIVLVRGVAQDFRMNKDKENFKSRRSNVHIVDYDSNSSNDESEVYVAEFVWPFKA